MKPLSLFAMLLIFAGCFPDVSEVSPPKFTEISGSISGTLTLKDAPYHVTDTLLVDANVTLAIEPAVRLFFADSALMIVKGQLTAIGDASRFIEFSDIDGQWKGIKFVTGSGRSQMRFCIVEEVYVEGQNSLQISAIEVHQSTLNIQNCIIRNNHSGFGGGLYCTGSNVTLTNSIIRDNFAETFGGAVLCDDSQAQINNNTILNNLSFNYGGGVVLVNPLAVEIQNNIFYRNSNSTGDPRIALRTGDSTNLTAQFNFLALPGLNPGFESDADLHLTSVSPCKDAGNPDASFRDVDGSRNDQGAYGGLLGDW